MDGLGQMGKCKDRPTIRGLSMNPGSGAILGTDTLLCDFCTMHLLQTTIYII